MSFFKRRTPKQKLEKEYRRKLSEAHRLSAINRSASDKLIYEAEEILKKINAFETKDRDWWALNNLITQSIRKTVWIGFEMPFIQTISQQA